MCDMKVELAEVMWQESDANMWNALAQELETVAQCLPVEEEDEHLNMRGDDRRDGLMAHIADGEQRDGFVPGREVHS